MNRAMPPVEDSPVRSQPDATALASIQSLYDAGRYLDAWHAAQAYAPVAAWTATPALILGGRLAAQWGDNSLGDRLHLRAFRQSPGSDDALYYHALRVQSRHGLFEALRLLSARTTALPPTPATQAQADLWSLQSRLLAGFRDFDAAESCLSPAEKAFPRSPWLWTVRSGLLREQDRYEEALDSTRQAMELQPWYRPAVQARAHLLQLLGRDDEALAFLEEAQQHLQCAALVQTYVLALDEKSRNEDMLAALDRLPELQPLASAGELRWRAARRCDAAYRLKDDARALAAAREAGRGYYEEIARRLSSPAAPDERRVHLPVGFIRQHHMTCAPATMAALSRYWSQPVDHLQLAREICYDGTPAHLERAWAEEHGWIVREFRVSWDSARALLDRGCPFALVTVGIRSGHMQAVIGYDSRLGTLLIRDPYQRSYSEWLAAALLETHASSGPRGLVMLPAGKAALLDALELPDETLHTRFHELQLALSRHARDAAEAALAALEAAASDHRLTLRARFELAFYDANPAQALPPLLRLREQFPNDVNLQLDELQLLSQLGRTDDRRGLLRKLSGHRSAPTVFQRQEAEELTRDARLHPRAFKLLLRSLRRTPCDALALSALANLLWNTGRHEEAACIYRLAACSADKVEAHWDSYFKASRHIRETDESLSLIRKRFDEWGDRSSQPARTLFECLEALDRSPEAFEVLEGACAKRPCDGELLLFAADAHGRYGRYAEAQNLIETASSKTSPAAWRRCAASLASYQGKHALALEHWREIAAINPADTFAHGSVARLMAVAEGPPAAIGYLDDACRAHPHLLPLRQTQIQWLRDEDPARLLGGIDALLALDPANAWAWREKALALIRLQRTGEALSCAEEALHLAPFSPSSHGVRADVLKAMNRLSDAREGYRNGIRLSIDADWLFGELVAACPDFSTRREAIVFIKEELLRQPSLENACLQFRTAARSILSPEELQNALELLWKRHPESWSAWSVLTNHLLERGLLPQALSLASDASACFPLTPRVWLDLANVQAELGDTAAAAEACGKALAISPAWGNASRHLSKIHERTLHLDLAAQVLHRAISLDPGDAYNHGWLADVLWRMRETEAAIEAAEKAIAIMPGYGWAWSRLDEWSLATGQPSRARQLAETLTLTRPGEAETWLRLVRLRFGDHDSEANLAALDRAALLAPRNPDIYDLRAELLTMHKRYDEALDACHPPAFGHLLPVSLQGRAAWIEYRRGRLDKAIERMSAVVETHPDYLWGWSLLTKWYWESDRLESVKEAAARWAWLAPEAALPHGYIATIHKQDGRKKEAKEALARSLAADPTYDFGAFELLGLQLADGEFDDAGRTLRHIQTHFSPAEHLRALLHYDRARQDHNAVREHLQTLARLPELRASELSEAVGVVLNANWEKDVEKALSPLLREETVIPEIGRHWAQARAKKSLPLTLWRLSRLSPTPAHRRNVDFTLVEQLGEGKRVFALRLFCLLRRRPLRAHEETWGQVGYAFNTSLRFRSAVRWMHDWRRHPEAPPWMRVNLIQSLYSCGKTAEARDALLVALERPRDHTHDMLLVWLVCEQALDGDTAGAVATRDRITESGRSDYDKALLTFTECMVAVQQAAPDDKSAALAGARDRLKRKAVELPAICTAPALKRFHRRTLRRLGQDGGSAWLRVRSHLPFFPASETSGLASIPAPLVWIALVVLFGSLRSCVALLE